MHNGLYNTVHSFASFGHSMATSGSSGGKPNPINPLEQFEIKNLSEVLDIGGITFAFSNASLWILITTFIPIIILFASTSKYSKDLVPNRMQSILEITYDFIANMVRQNAGVEGLKYVPFIFSIFIFVLSANLLGMLPYSFSITSQIVVTFALSFLVCFFITCLGFWLHGWRFLKLFAPKGVPIALLLLLIPIEIISYLMRPISLSVRLFANMLAGHIMLKVFGGFVILAGPILGIIPFTFTVLLTCLELGVAFLQAYVFTVLTCLYLENALNPSH